MSIDIYSTNFRQNGLWKRVAELVGGNERLTAEWWLTPIPLPPFNLRTPNELMMNDEFDSVRIYLERLTDQSQPIDYGPQVYYNSVRDGLQRTPGNSIYKTRKDRRKAGIPEESIGYL